MEPIEVPCQIKSSNNPVIMDDKTGQSPEPIKILRGFMSEVNLVSGIIKQSENTEMPAVKAIWIAKYFLV